MHDRLIKNKTLESRTMENWWNCLLLISCYSIESSILKIGSRLVRAIMMSDDCNLAAPSSFD